MEMGGGWVLEVDIQSSSTPWTTVICGAFSTSGYATECCVALIGKWLKAGVLEEGQLSSSRTPARRRAG